MAESKVNQWQTINAMSTERIFSAGVIVSNDKFVVLGGEDENENMLNTIEMFNHESKQWTKIPLKKPHPHFSMFC